MDYKLKRLIYDYEDQPIKIKSLIDREESLKFEKYRIKLKKDRVIKIPYWVGKILKKMNYVEYISEDSSEPGELKRIVQRERMESSLTKLERFYYRIILNEMKNLSEEKNTESIFALESIKKNFEELFEIRTKKILSMVRTSNPPRKNDLLLDEKIFFDGLINKELKKKKCSKLLIAVLVLFYLQKNKILQKFSHIFQNHSNHIF